MRSVEPTVHEDLIEIFDELRLICCFFRDVIRLGINPLHWPNFRSRMEAAGAAQARKDDARKKESNVSNR